MWAKAPWNTNRFCFQFDHLQRGPHLLFKTEQPGNWCDNFQSTLSVTRSVKNPRLSDDLDVNTSHIEVVFKCKTTETNSRSCPKYLALRKKVQITSGNPSLNCNTVIFSKQFRRNFVQRQRRVIWLNCDNIYTTVLRETCMELHPWKHWVYGTARIVRFC